MAIWRSISPSQFKIACHFAFDEPVLIQDPAVATHLYRIVQEAVHNAIRHGKARNMASTSARPAPESP